MTSVISGKRSNCKCLTVYNNSFFINNSCRYKIMRRSLILESPFFLSFQGPEYLKCKFSGPDDLLCPCIKCVLNNQDVLVLSLFNTHIHVYMYYIYYNIYYVTVYHSSRSYILYYSLLLYLVCLFLLFHKSHKSPVYDRI